MDLGRQIYLSNKKNFGSKMIFEQQKQKYLPEFFSSEKNYFLKTNLKKNFGKIFLKKNFQLQVTHILSKFQVIQTTASLCHNVISHKKVKKNKND